VNRLILLLVLAIPLASQENRFRVEPFILGSVHSITGLAGEKWKQDRSFGGGVRFPVANVPVNAAFSIEAGEIDGAGVLPDFFSLNSSIALEYEYQQNRFRLIGGFGIANLLISSEESFEITKPFAGESENEFGLALYAEPAVRWDRVSVGIRVQERLIGSAPERVNLLSLSLVAGVRF